MISIFSKYDFSLTDFLTRLLSEKEVDILEKDFPICKRLLCALAERLNKELDAKIKEAEAISNYDSPNWSLIQAENFGYRRAIRKILDTLGTTERNTL